MKGKKYTLLQKEMRRQGITRKELSYELQLCESSVNNRMQGTIDWSTKEQYKVLDYLGVPHNELHLYFPPNGEEESTPAPIGDSLSPNEQFIIMAERCIQLARHYGREAAL